MNVLPVSSVDGEQRAAIDAPVTYPADDALTWLTAWSRKAAEAGCGRAFTSELAAGLAEKLGVSHWAVALAVEAAQRMTIDLARRVPGEPCAAGIQRSLELAEDDSLLGQAIRAQQTFCETQISSHSGTGQLLVRSGIRSAAVAPLNCTSDVSGAILLGHDKPRQWTGDELSLLEMAGQLAGSTIARADAARRTALDQIVRDSTDAMMIFLSCDGRIVDANRAAHLGTEFEVSELVGRSVWSTLLVAEEFEHVKQAFGRLHRCATTERFESYILTKRGDRRRISWSLSRTPADAAGEVSMILTGIDITQRCRALERALRAEETATNMKKILAEVRGESFVDGLLSDGKSTSRQLPAGVDSDRRCAPRRAYPYMQLVAPLRNFEVPDANAFAQTKCMDISSRGFAFLTDRKPDYDRVIVAFGTPPQVVYLAAEIRHATARPDVFPPEYIVGCRYTGRLRGV